MDEVESDAWLQLVTILELLPPSLDAQLQQDSQLTHFEFMVLSLLRFAPGQVMQAKELATSTNATLPRLSHVVSRLADRGVVERLPCPGDKRATNVHLTDAGRRAVVRATSSHIDHVRRLVIDRLTREELTALAGIGAKITAVLDPNNRGFGPAASAHAIDEAGSSA
ncbi:MAG: MarR family transcriptional regulator [Naasia sp.]|nr:MarR family transcriptional regulator [Naasia sp.]